MQLVTARVYVKVAKSSKKKRLLLSVLLTCGTETVQATVNAKKRGVWLYPRRVMTDAGRCRVVATSGLGTKRRDRVYVSASIVGDPVAWGGNGQTSGWPVLINSARQEYAAAPVELPVGEAPDVQVTGDAKLTSCTTANGSREGGSPQMCRGRVNPRGSVVDVEVVAKQLTSDGTGVCRERIVSKRRKHIDKHLHHTSIFQHGTFSLANIEGCSRIVRVEIVVDLVSGADLVVHRRGTLSTLSGGAL